MTDADESFLDRAVIRIDEFRREWVGPKGLCLLEPDAMFGEIRCVLSVIPLELYGRHLPCMSLYILPRQSSTLALDKRAARFVG
jgi:hypothetical protein